MSKSIIQILILFVVIAACKPVNKNSELSINDQLANNLNVFIDSCWNDQNVSKLNELVDKNFTRILNGIYVAGNENEMAAHMNVYFTGFPDLKIQYSDAYIEGNNIFMNWECTGSNTGEFGEMRATGKKIKIQGLSHLYFNEEGKLYKEDVYYNELDLLQQLGYTLTSPVLE
ncbi:ester cyclase [uncultured Eudoraea sp.]|jgi:predicted ester cyclase|uniref:ester cyclase n=1 Tax=uncultured Eudoraea sp. TaxID=1035614 RepID=UPI002603030C|nr:ester cyclase [uncultured Eudoraea sp.]